MHIAIDDTYGPAIETTSHFVTGHRRTHVAVVFQDEDVDYIRTQMIECLEEVCTRCEVEAREFHFIDIYNKNAPWEKIQSTQNLMIFEFFASIYRRYKWPVFIQTIDDRTLKDHGIHAFVGDVAGFDLSNRGDLSLLFLLFKLKINYKKNPDSITMILDEGRGKPGTAFGSEIFHDWPESFKGYYSTSVDEPLLQIADFIAFCINRSTHLAMKNKRSSTDDWFMRLVGSMSINCNDLKVQTFSKNFSVTEFDECHMNDRAIKGL